LPEWLATEILRRRSMMRGALLWLVGIPVPIILVLWLIGFLS
jgi:hypothetical protein